QAEDGIRDRNVTGVQTCALPILSLIKWFSKKILNIFCIDWSNAGRFLNDSYITVYGNFFLPCMCIFSRYHNSTISRMRTKQCQKIGRASCRERENIKGGERGQNE